MSQALIQKVESAYKRELPEFEIGDTVEIRVRIVEGEKERIQSFTGTVIARGGQGMSETFTVRRIVGDEGVERVWPVHCPSIADIIVKRKSKVRRAKLYFLRDRKGKATRLRERRVVSTETTRSRRRTTARAAKLKAERAAQNAADSAPTRDNASGGEVSTATADA